MRLLSTAALVILAACAIVCAVAELRVRYWQRQKRRQIRLRDAHDALINEEETG